MRPQRKTCFVVSPIGPEGSDIRKRADDLFELIIEPALEKYSFDVIRADRIPRSTSITAEVVQLVQESDLCVIDLTGHNPNVFYECGRRHEIGKPFVQVIQKGETIPFDLAGIRTIFYDINSARSVREAVRNLQLYVDEFEVNAYASASAGISLATVASSLDRIERKISQFMVASNPVTFQQRIGEADQRGDLDPFVNPQSAIMEALESGDVERAAAWLPRFVQRVGPTTESVATAALLTQAGFKVAADTLLSLLISSTELVMQNLDIARSAVSALVHFHNIIDDEADVIPLIEPVINEMLETQDLNDKNRAYFTNQLAKLYSGSGNKQRTLELAEEVVRLAPTDTAYLYNCSIAAMRLGLDQLAQQRVDAYMREDFAGDSPDEDHLQHAIRVYVAADRLDDARSALARLAEISPVRAQLISTMEKIDMNDTGPG